MTRTPTDRLTVTAHTSIDDCGAEWDTLMNAADAPVFYRRPFLRAFEQHPLHPVQQTAYLLVRDHTGRAVAGLPAYLQQRVDPMRVLADHLPQTVDMPVVFSHVWHCFDTVLPLHPQADDTAAHTLLSALRRQATAWDATLIGLANIDAAHPHTKILAQAGLHPVEIDTGWGLDLRAVPDFDTYLNGLGKAPRRNMRHDLRNAQDAGLTTSFHPPHEADLDGFVRLARATAAKHHNSDYYRPGRFQDFVRALGNDVRVLELRIDGHLVGSALALVDPTRLHFWACGIDYDACPGFSPFYIAFAELLREAMANRRPWFEGGRRNPVFKRRYGLTPRTLTAWTTPI
ncbi:GNAT family N-acetyltransferase [Streptomyces sp. NPDC001880]